MGQKVKMLVISLYVHEILKLLLQIELQEILIFCDPNVAEEANCCDKPRAIVRKLYH